MKFWTTTLTVTGPEGAAFLIEKEDEDGNLINAIFIPIANESSEGYQAISFKVEIPPDGLLKGSGAASAQGIVAQADHFDSPEDFNFGKVSWPDDVPENWEIQKDEENLNRVKITVTPLAGSSDSEESDSGSNQNGGETSNILELLLDGDGAIETLDWSSHQRAQAEESEDHDNAWDMFSEPDGVGRVQEADNPVADFVVAPIVIRNNSPVFNEGIQDKDLVAVMPVNDFLPGQKGDRIEIVFPAELDGLEFEISLETKESQEIFEGSLSGEGIARLLNGTEKFSSVVQINGEEEILEIISIPVDDALMHEGVYHPKRGFGQGAGKLQVEISINKISDAVLSANIGIFEIQGYPQIDGDSVEHFYSRFLERREKSSTVFGIDPHNSPPQGYGGFVLKGARYSSTPAPKEGGQSIVNTNPGDTFEGLRALEWGLQSSTAGYGYRTVGVTENVTVSQALLLDTNHNIPIITGFNLKSKIQLRAVPNVWENDKRSILDGEMQFLQVLKGTAEVKSTNPETLTDVSLDIIKDLAISGAWRSAFAVYPIAGWLTVGVPTAVSSTVELAKFAFGENTSSNITGIARYLTVVHLIEKYSGDPKAVADKPSLSG